MEDMAKINTFNSLFSGNDLVTMTSSGIDVSKLRVNSALRDDEWALLDARVVDVARARLNGINDLRAAGLVHDLGGLGTTVSQYEKASDMSSADVSMDGATKGEEDAVDYTLISVPVPIIHKDFRIGLRKLEASRKLGESLDTVQAEIAARKVAETLESILFLGASNITINGQQLDGYTSFDDVNTATGAADWGTVDKIYPNVLAMVDACEQDGFFGPYMLYVATTQFGQMRQVYSAVPSQTAYDRVKSGISSIIDIKPCSLLTDSAVLVQLTRDVVDLAVGMDIVTVPWQSDGGMTLHFKVMAAAAPRVKSDYNGNCGIAVITGI